MPINTRHPQYAARQPEWVKCRDAYGGSTPVKAAGTKYLPWTEANPDQTEYNDYLTRAVWYDAMERTVNGLVGAVTRKETAYAIPSAMEADMEDVTLSGTTFDAFAALVLREQLTPGRLAVEVAYPEEEGAASRPYWNLWGAESLVNWRTMRIDGVVTLVWAVLEEPAPKPGRDEYSHETVTRYREMVLVNPTGERYYGQRIWVKRTTSEGEVWVIEKEIIPTRRGSLLTKIPLTIINAGNTDADAGKPPLLGLANQDFAHYRNSADYEMAVSMIKPIYYFFGVPTGQKIVLGSKRSVTSEDNQATAGILQGADPVGLEKAMAMKVAYMATLGGRMLEAAPLQAETASAVKMRHTGEESSLRTVAQTMAQGLTLVLRDHAEWLGADPESIEVTPNLDYIDATLLPDQVRAYMELQQSGLISYETFYALLQGGELTRPGVDAETEQEAIGNDADGDLMGRQGDAAAGLEAAERIQNGE